MDRLKGERFCCSTKKTYYRIWKTFNEFFLRLDIKPMSWEKRLILFVGYLVTQNRQSSTIKSYVSTIRATLADINIHISENKFLLTSLTRACRLHNDKILHKFPVHKGLVQIILRTVETYWNETTPQLYLVTLYQAMFITAYYALFLVGGITMNENSHTIKAKDVHIELNKNKLLFLLHSSKTHCQGNVPQTMKISAIGNGASKVRFCSGNIYESDQKERRIVNPSSYFAQVIQYPQTTLGKC